MKYLFLLPILFLCSMSFAQNQHTPTSAEQSSDEAMKTYVIERIIPGAGALSSEELQGISQLSCSILKEMGPAIEWQHSYVTGDKVYCVYKAESKALIEEHAKKGNFPANSISEVAVRIGPHTAKE